MDIRLEDIPVEGRELTFSIDNASLNTRLTGDGKLTMSPFSCSGTPTATVELQANGKTVVIQGDSQAEFIGVCSRCTEDAHLSIDCQISMVLKPHGSSPNDEIEDVQLGYYDGKEIHLAPIVEEQLVLSLPFVVLCKESCKGLCPQCGSNLNNGMCACKPAELGEPAFQVLKSLKLS